MNGGNGGGERWPLWGVGRGKHPEAEDEAPSIWRGDERGRPREKVSTRRGEGKEG